MQRRAHKRLVYPGYHRTMSDNSTKGRLITNSLALQPDNGSEGISSAPAGSGWACELSERWKAVVMRNSFCKTDVCTPSRPGSVRSSVSAGILRTMKKYGHCHAADGARAAHAPGRHSRRMAFYLPPLPRDGFGRRIILTNAMLSAPEAPFSPLTPMKLERERL